MGNEARINEPPMTMPQSIHAPAVAEGVETCPVCDGAGTVTTTHERLKFLAHLEAWAALRDKSNEELARLTTEIGDCLRECNAPPEVYQWIDEVWWRLHVANEPVEETQRKIEALGKDEEWLKKD